MRASPRCSPAWVLVGLLPVGCAVEQAPPAEPAALLDLAGWEPAQESADPVPEHRPPEVDCSALSWFVEANSLEVDTTFCNYLTLIQPLAAPVMEGDTLRWSHWHQDLFAAEPAEGHLALSLGGDLVWEQDVPIPSEPDYHEVSWRSDRDFAAGDDIVLHLHNHGTNTWNIGLLELLEEG